MRLLVAEDVDVSRRMLVNALSRMGHEAVPAANGREAWELLRREPLRLAVIDWMMPEMDGLELVRRVRAREDGPYVYLILLTSRADRDDRLAGLDAGADDYIIKPFDPEELRCRIRAGERVVRLEQELADSNRRLRSLALSDELTGVGNRRAFREAYGRMMAMSRRYGTPLTVTMIDIDRFKAYNDALGHEAGDQALQQVAKIVTANIRSADQAFRYGGEEFTCLFPMTGPAGSHVVAERLRARVEAAGLPHPLGGPLTVSVGYACSPLTGVGPGDDLLAIADRALYDSKRAGRNRSTGFEALQQDEPAPEAGEARAAEPVSRPPIRARGSS